MGVPRFRILPAPDGVPAQAGDGCLHPQLSVPLRLAFIPGVWPPPGGPAWSQPGLCAWVRPGAQSSLHWPRGGGAGGAGLDVSRTCLPDLSQPSGSGSRTHSPCFSSGLAQRHWLSSSTWARGSACRCGAWALRFLRMGVSWSQYLGQAFWWGWATLDGPTQEKGKGAGQLCAGARLPGSQVCDSAWAELPGDGGWS